MRARYVFLTTAAAVRRGGGAARAAVAACGGYGHPPKGGRRRSPDFGRWKEVFLADDGPDERWMIRGSGREKLAF